MWPDLCALRLVTSPVTRTAPSSFSSTRFTCAVNSLTVHTRRGGSLGNNSPKSHWDFELRGIASIDNKVCKAGPEKKWLRGVAQTLLGAVHLAVTSTRARISVEHPSPHPSRRPLPPAHPAIGLAPWPPQTAGVGWSETSGSPARSRGPARFRAGR